MNRQAHILITGRDPDLLYIRELVLKSAGYHVSATLVPIRSFSGLRSVQLLIICHTLSVEERRSDLNTLASASPDTIPLCMMPRSEFCEAGVASLDCLRGPSEMLHVVHELLSNAPHHPSGMGQDH